jgi:hypothetical protein
MSLVKVWTDIGKKKPVPLLAKIVEKEGPIITIKYLTEGKNKIWKYENDIYDIEEDSIAEYCKTDDEGFLGFIERDGGFIHVKDDDEEYLPDVVSEDDDNYDEDEDEDEDESDEDDEEEEEFDFENEEDDEEEDVEDDEDEEDNYLEE